MMACNTTRWCLAAWTVLGSGLAGGAPSTTRVGINVRVYTRTPDDQCWLLIGAPWQRPLDPYFQDMRVCASMRGSWIVVDSLVGS